MHLPHPKLLWRRTAGIVAVLAIALAAWLVWVQRSGNFATVATGLVYRSNQPTPERLAAYTKAVGLKSVLNLRGADMGAGWYRAERQAAADLGLTLIDFPMAANRELTQAESAALLDILRNAPKPLLIHCKSGSDRTGLAAVLYLALVLGQDEELAERQLSIRYGHFAVPVLSAAWPMDTTWELIEAWWGIEDD